MCGFRLHRRLPPFRVLVCDPLSPSRLYFFPRQPLTSPLLYRTTWHVPLFPNELVLKLCLHEDDRTSVRPTLAALDPRGCYVLVLPRGGSNAGREPSAARGSPSGRSTLASFTKQQQLLLRQQQQQYRR